jgi:hypothetical protein
MERLAVHERFFIADGRNLFHRQGGVGEKSRA